MAYSLLYVSKTLLERPEAEAEEQTILAAAAARNARLGVTGALLSTGTYFAQLLEGEQDAVEALMSSIDADARHMRIKIIRTADEARRFAGSPLAYSGQASVADRHIAPFFSPLPQGDAAHLALRLAGLMEEFVRLPQA